MNDWRSTFGGVNDHEADWEQVTVFLVPLDEDAERANRRDGSDVLRVGWVAFSSHDETGDDLRRRWTTRTSPGSITPTRSCMPAPDPIPARTCRANTWCASNRQRCTVFLRSSAGPVRCSSRGHGITRRPALAFRMSTTNAATGSTSGRVHRTPGRRSYQRRNVVGPGLQRPLGAGHRRSVGGERAPAGPRYERNGTIRPSWADPSAGPAWTRSRHRSRVRPRRGSRLTAFQQQREALTAELAAQEAVLQELSATATALPPMVSAWPSGWNRRGRTSCGSKKPHCPTSAPRAGRS